MEEKTLLESLNTMDDEKLLAMSEKEFGKWVMSFAGVLTTSEQYHKMNYIKSRYNEIHDDYEDRTSTLIKDTVLVEALSLSVNDIDGEYPNVESILPLLDEEYYTSIKLNNIVKHQAFPGIPDLGSPILGDRYKEFKIKDFNELVKAIGMMHGPKLYDANYDWLIDVDNPSLPDCVCFKEEADALDTTDIKNTEFKLHMGYVPHTDWIVKHTKTIIAIAKIYLHDPLRYYKAYISSHKDKLKGIDFSKDLVEQLIQTRDIEEETMFIVLIDLLEHGFTYADVGIINEE